jgi:hypothetical protein
MSRLALSVLFALVACGAREPARTTGTPRTAPAAPRAPQPEVAGRDFAQADAAFETTVAVSSRAGIGNVVGTSWPGTLKSSLAVVQTIHCSQGPRDCVMPSPATPGHPISANEYIEPKLGKVTCAPLAGWTTSQTSVALELPRVRACFAVETRPAAASLAAAIARAANGGLDIASAVKQEVGRLPMPRVATLWEVAYDGCTIEHPNGVRDCHMTPRGCPPPVMHPTSSDTIVVRDGKESYDDVLVPFKPQPWPVKLYRNADVTAADVTKFDAAVTAAKAGNWSAAVANLASAAELARSGPDDVRHAFARYIAELDLAQAALLAGDRTTATDATARALTAKARILENANAYPSAGSAANSMNIQLDLVTRLDTPWSTIGDPCSSAP